MSTEPEDMLEEALRGDLPTPDAEARVRRRLLAAGVAVGNGVATTTAAAAGASATAKLAGLSWGLKLGLVAAVAIPSVGLLLDSRSERSGGPGAPQVASARPGGARAPAQPARPEPPAPVELAAKAEAEPVAPAAERPQPAAATKATLVEAAAPSRVSAPPARPSQADFAAPAEAAPAASAPGSSLAEETRLLDSAFAALTASNLTRAAALIHEHETRFPAGLLQRERERAKTRLSELSRGE